MHTKRSRRWSQVNLSIYISVHPNESLREKEETVECTKSKKKKSLDDDEWKLKTENSFGNFASSSFVSGSRCSVDEMLNEIVYCIESVLPST